MAVTDSVDPHDMLVRAVPQLQGWRDQMDDYRDTTTSFYSLLATQVIQLAEGGAIPAITHQNVNPGWVSASRVEFSRQSRATDK